MSENFTPEQIGQRIREAREYRGWNQTQLAEALASSGLPLLAYQSTIAKIESGMRPVRLHEAPAFAEALSVSIKALLGGTDLYENVDAFQAGVRHAVSVLQKEANR